MFSKSIKNDYCFSPNLIFAWMSMLWKKIGRNMLPILHRPEQVDAMLCQLNRQPNPDRLSLWVKAWAWVGRGRSIQWTLDGGACPNVEEDPVYDLRSLGRRRRRRTANSLLWNQDSPRDWIEWDCGEARNLLNMMLNASRWKMIELLWTCLKL